MVARDNGGRAAFAGEDFVGFVEFVSFYEVSCVSHGVAVSLRTEGGGGGIELCLRYLGFKNEVSVYRVILSSLRTECAAQRGLRVSKTLQVYNEFRFEEVATEVGDKLIRTP